MRLWFNFCIQLQPVIYHLLKQQQPILNVLPNS